MHPLVTLQNVEVREVAHVAKQHNGYVDAPLDGLALLGAERDAVLLLNIYIGEVRHDTNDRHTTKLLDHPTTTVEEAHIAAELVDEYAADALPVLRGLEHDGAIDGGKDAAPIDVGHQQDGSVSIARHGEVDKVYVAKVQLRDAAGALHDDGVVTRSQSVESGMHLSLQFGAAFASEVGRGVLVARRTTVQDDLRGAVARRLEQERIHVRMAGHASGFGLHRLRAAQFETVGGDEGVQRHVLRLEGRGMVAVLEKDATERGGDHALADVAARTREHDGAEGGMHWNHV